MNIKMRNVLAVIALMATVFISSCRKDDFDTPPAGGSDPALIANTTIADLKAGYVAGNFDSIDTDIIIAGVVIADDKSGNFYKTIVLQDSTGGIAIRIDISDYYTKYPVGRRVFVKCKGLWLGDYNELIQLGGYVDNSNPSQPSVEPIPYTLVDNYLIPGVYNLTVNPKLVTINQVLADPDFYQNTLIQLNQVEFADADTGKTYADMVLQQSRNLVVKNCSGGSIELRSSNFATFGGDNVPNGNGSLVSVFSVFGSDAQLYIRDVNDVAMDTTRCAGNPPPPGAGVNETFSSQTSGSDISLAGWSNTAVVGNRYWRAATFSGDTYAQATAFGSSLPNMESWLITPAFDLATADTLSFRSSWGFFVHNGLSVWISTDYDGVNFASATWTQLTCTLAVQADGQYVWIPSGNVPLTAFSGNSAHIGFKYSGDGTTNTTTWRIDDVVVK
jgi:hypothetical protein